MTRSARVQVGGTEKEELVDVGSSQFYLLTPEAM